MEDDHDQTTTIAPIAGDGIAENSKQPVVIIMTGPTAGQSINLNPKSIWSLGRSTECDIVFQEASVSRNHATIERVGDETWELKDLGSSNGTWINNEKCSTRKLEAGDKVQLGSSIVIKFVFQDEVEVAFQKELYESATKDGLTNLFSKRYFLEQLDVEFNFHRRTKKPLSVVMSDIDHFKKINDTYGHLAGDFVLREIGRILLNVLRQGDVGGRYGGEEMVFLLRETPLMGAKTFAERLRELIQNHSFIFEGKKISVTVSLGCATATQGNFSSSNQLIAQADEFLYKAKRAGRNQTCSLIDSE